MSSSLKTSGGVSITPDMILDGSRGGLKIVEYKHYLPGTTLQAMDLEKIKAYYQAAKAKTKVHQNKSIEVVEYVFSSKEGFEKNYENFGLYLRYVIPKYVDSYGNIKS